MDKTNIIAFPSNRSSPLRGAPVSTPPGKTPGLYSPPDLPIHSELLEIAALSRRLINMIEHLEERLTEQERRLQLLDKRLLQMAKIVFDLPSSTDPE